MAATKKPKVEWLKFRAYRGPRIRGEEPYELPPDRRDFHVDRAFWLTAKVETGARYGSVIAYDGTGMTAGLDQHIAVYPKELAHEDFNAADDQGGFWELLRRLETVDGNTGFQSRIAQLWVMLENEGWYLAQDGQLRYIMDGGKGRFKHQAGDIVFGKEIRDTLTPVRGKVVSKDQMAQAAEWIKAVHLVFAHPDGFRAQAMFGIEHLVHRVKRRKIGWAYGGREVTALRVGTNYDERDDLAMCMYQAHSVNAPAIANKALRRARFGKSIDPRRLIRLLGNNKYGRWDDDIKGGRYQRTRLAARGSGLWPRTFFDGPKAIMPKNLPG
jgi:hypothetical protein